MNRCELYPYDLWRCARCHSTFPLHDNGRIPRHIERTSYAWCPSLHAEIRVYQGKR